MNGFLDVAYPWLKAAHLIFVIFWMAGLFMLPRFFIYHQQELPGSEQDKRWLDRENRLRKIILAPSMVVVWVLGLVLAWYIGAWTMGWFHAKLLLVLVLTGFHGWMIGYGKKLAAGERKVGDKALRLANEIPGIAIPLIVILVIVKPF